MLGLLHLCMCSREQRAATAQGGLWDFLDGQTKWFMQFIQSQDTALCDAGTPAAVLRKLLGPHPSSMQIKAGLAVSELSKQVNISNPLATVPGTGNFLVWLERSAGRAHGGNTDTQGSPFQAARTGAVNLLLYNYFVNSQAREDLIGRELNKLILYRFFL